MLSTSGDAKVKGFLNLMCECISYICLTIPTSAVGDLSMYRQNGHVSILYGSAEYPLARTFYDRWPAVPSLPFLVRAPFLGLDEKGIQQILRAARKKANLLTFNGMELAVLRAEGSDKLDLSG